MNIINTQTGKVLARILGGDGLTLEDALALSGMDTTQTSDTGETVWVDADGDENWFDNMVLEEE